MQQKSIGQNLRNQSETGNDKSAKANGEIEKRSIRFTPRFPMLWIEFLRYQADCLQQQSWVSSSTLEYVNELGFQSFAYRTQSQRVGSVLLTMEIFRIRIRQIYLKIDVKSTKLGQTPQGGILPLSAFKLHLPPFQKQTNNGQIKT